MKNIAIFASGSGSNAENIFHFFNQSQTIRPVLILCNRPDAYVLERAKKIGLPSVVFSREQFLSGDVNKILTEYSVEYVILAGFLWLIPDILIKQFPCKIINIHPALLPKYGGKGMYGMKVHEQVWLNKEKESGITIHLVNEEYDKGQILFQARCAIDNSDTPETIAKKIHQLEYLHYPAVIQSYICGHEYKPAANN